MTWRLVRAADEPALRAIHARQQTALEPPERYAFPDLADPRYLRVWVAEDERGGARGAVVAHATVEVYAIAGDPWLLRAACRRRPVFARELCRLGCDEAHCFVPASLLARMRPWLSRSGFAESNSAYRAFYRSLAEGDDGEG